MSYKQIPEFGIGVTVWSIEEPMTFRKSPVQEHHRFPLESKGTISQFDEGDNTYLVRWHNSNDEQDTFWVDPDCFTHVEPYPPVTDEEMDEVFKLLGVDP